MNKIWQKEFTSHIDVDKFTVGDDRNLDLRLAPFDVLGSMAHIIMLSEKGMLNKEELPVLWIGLKNIWNEIDAQSFKIDDDVEDIHSQIEGLLTQRLGEVGKKIHAARSRNDQILVDLKLYFRHEIKEITDLVSDLFDLLLKLSEQHKDKLMPGYTHLQLAMPSSFGLWFGAYAESLTDDLQLLQSCYKVVNKNPLGSAAGYGSSLPINRQRTTELLGFDDLNYNVIYAQMGRGKVERILSQAMAGIASTLSKMAMDITLFLNQHFNFIAFPSELTTGSSIMPHKKNPDVFELIRARCNRIISLPADIIAVTNNLPSGYHRDFQQLKSLLFPEIDSLKSCLKMCSFMLAQIEVKDDLLKDEKFKYLFSVEEVNRLVVSGMPFREAYIKVGKDIENGTFNPDFTLNHTHEGSLGNLCLAEINTMFQKIRSGFDFEKVERSYENLLNFDLSKTTM